MGNKEKTEELKEKLTNGISQVKETENFKQWLRYISSFHTYSWSNSFLIQWQYPSATRCMGLKQWSNKHNRKVKKGERGIAILAPRIITDEDTKEQKVIGFFTVYVFDVSQTEGEPLPEICVPFEGDDNGVYNELYKTARQLGIKDILESDKDSTGIGAEGWYRPASQVIWIKNNNSRAMQAMALAHELAHHLDHKDDEEKEVVPCDPKSEKELVAEAVAFVVMDHFGIDVNGYAFEYLAAWNGDEKLMKQLFGRIHKYSKTIIERIEQDAEST